MRIEAEQAEQVEQWVKGPRGLIGAVPIRCSGLFRRRRRRPSADRVFNGPEMSERGLQADIKALLAADAEPSEGDQLDLGIFDDFVSPVAEQQLARAVAIRRPGRPLGSKSRTNLNVVRLIKATKRPSILALKEIVDMPFEEFLQTFGFTDRDRAFGHWSNLLKLSIAYEEGQPAQRLELDAKGGPVMPVVVFGDVPVRPDLAEGNPPEDERAIDVTEWRDISTNDMDDPQGAQPKAHDDDESQPWPDPEA